MLDENQIQSNWNKFRDLINNTFTGDRKDSLNKMYDFLEERIVLTPASGKEHFHNAFPGGYVDHVLRVIELSLQFKELWEKNGVELNFTDEELIFSAMHHDLGKVGDTKGDYYIANDSQWHREKMGLLYKFNDEIHHMTVSDRTFWMLQNFGVKFSQVEWIGIRCTDGLYEPENETYLMQAEPGRQLKTNIAYILHQADFTASRIEFLDWKKSKAAGEAKPKSTDESQIIFKKTNIGRISSIVAKNHTSSSQKQMFDDLFK